MRLEEGVHRVSDAGREPRAKTRLGRDGHGRKSRHSHVARLCPSRRRRGTNDAAAGGGRAVERPGGRTHGREWRHHACPFAPYHELRQGRGGRGQASGSGSGEHQAQGSEGLEDRRQTDEAARYRREARWPPCLRDRRQVAGDALRGHQGLPGVRRQARELRRSEDCRPSRIAARGQGERHDRGGGGRYLVAGQDGARRAADRLGRRPGSVAIERDDRRAPPGGSDGTRRLRHEAGRRRAEGHRRRRQESRGGVLDAVPRPRDDGADELHRSDHSGAGRSVGRHPERRSFARRALRGIGTAARQVRGLQAPTGRRLRPPRRCTGLRAPGRGHREAVSRYPDQDDLEPRRGHGARFLPPRFRSAGPRPVSTKTGSSSDCMCACRASRSTRS